jgi:hypothetical protein
MSYDMERFEQPLVDDSQAKALVWTDIGEAEVAHSIFGKAKVHVYRKRDEVRGALRWTLATVGLVAGAVWLINDVSRQPAIVYVAPPLPVVESATPEPKLPVVAPNKPRAVPPVAAKDPLPQPMRSAPVAAGAAPVVASGASAPVVATAQAVKPATVASPAPVMVKPAAPAMPLAASAPLASKHVVPQAPAASAVTATH